MSSNAVDALIIGGGITGLSFATLLATSGRSVMLVRRGDMPVPQAEVLRNQGWLQSGFMYLSEIRRLFDKSIVDQAAMETALQMYGAGSALHQQLKIGRGYLTGNIPAILHVPRTRKRAILKNVDLMRTTAGTPVWSSIQPASVELLTRAVGKPLADEFMSDDAVNFSLPDRPFDEAAILTLLRDKAIQFGAQLYNADQPVTAADGDTFFVGDAPLPSAKITIIAAGLGTTQLLSDLGQSEMYKIRETPMMVTKKIPNIEAPILVDLKNSFSLVNPPGDNCVIGTTAKDYNVKDCDSRDRSISPKLQKTFLNILPEYIMNYADEGSYRITAGRELIPNWEDEFYKIKVKTTDPDARMHLHNQLPHRIADSNCWIVSPGRATTAYMYADGCIFSDYDDPKNIYYEIAQTMPSASNSPCDDIEDSCPHITAWTEADPIYMHFDSFYESLDDRD